MATMDDKASALLATLKRPAVNSDTKLNALNSLKSDIKHFRVPESAQVPIFECLRLAIAQQASSQLASSAFSTLAHLVKRLGIQDPSGHTLSQLAPRLFGALQDRLGDAREPLRASASQALGELWPVLGADVERIVRDEVLGGSNARAKEAGMGWVVRMHRDEQMPFKSYVAPVVASLEDSDGTVREAAKNALVELFGSASEGAKADLKRQLKAHSVRHSIQTQILAQLGAGGSGVAPAEEMAASTRSLPSLEHVQQFAESLNSEAAQPPPQEAVPMDPVYVHSERELNDTLRDMLPHFEGKETEQNWMPRDKAVLKIRRLVKGNAPNEYHHAFMAGVKSLMEGILKVANTLRTTMSTNGCQLVQELMQTLGSAMDSHAEILLQSFVKMSSNTKHIAAENGKHTADVVFHHVTYNVRLMQHIWAAAQEKNAQTRQCAPEWLKTMLKRQVGYKTHFESSGGLELAEKCLRKGLDDANPKVKEGMRAAYWTFAKGWPEKADAIMNKLDPKSRTMLEKDPNNPNASLHASQSASTTTRPGLPSSRSTLKELMAEQRRAKSAARNLPERSTSAMATLSPQKSRPELSSASRGPSKLRSEQSRIASTASNATPAPASSSSATTAKGSSLMSGPVRRPRRPEMQRPQTADPYASRRLLRPETPANGSTPGNSPPKGIGASKASTATTSASRNRAKTAAPPARSREGSPNVRRSPMPSGKHLQESSRPVSQDSNAARTEDGSTLREDDFTMVLPSGRNGIGRRPNGIASSRPALDKTMSVDSGLPAMVEEDGFTMVIPNLSHSNRELSPLTYRSPLRNQFEEARGIADRASLSASHLRQRSDPFVETVGSGRLSPRRASPVKSVSPQPAEVQVYEDPATADDAETITNGERQVLSELPVNETVRLQSPTQSVGSNASPAGSPRHVSAESRSPAPPATPQDRAEIQRTRRLLASGIERLRARTLDAHGLRKVQDLARSPVDIWEHGAKYDELMTALLDYIRQAPDNTNNGSGKTAAVKSQALAVLRALLSLHRKYANSWYAPALTAVLSSGQGEAEQRTTASITTLSAPLPCLNALLTLLSTTPSSATPLAISTLRSLILATNSKNLPLDAPTKKALAGTAARYLEAADAEVRKADVELACEVFGLFGESEQGGKEFWGEFGGVEEGRLGLLAYYIARRGRVG